MSAWILVTSIENWLYIALRWWPSSSRSGPWVTA